MKENLTIERQKQLAQEIIGEVCGDYGVRKDVLLSKEKYGGVTLARNAAALIMAKLLFNHEVILSELLPGRNKNAVGAQIRSSNERYDRDHEFKKYVDNMTSLVNDAIHTGGELKKETLSSDTQADLTKAGSKIDPPSLWEIIVFVLRRIGYSTHDISDKSGANPNRVHITYSKVEEYFNGCNMEEAMLLIKKFFKPSNGK